MYFIGSGSLLRMAVEHTLKLGIKIDGVFCDPRDGVGTRIKDKVPVYFTESPNIDLPKVLAANKASKVFSINNSHILTDQLLDYGPQFFNIHNGLIQDYRGIAEICLFAAICNNERSYGATLHQLLPGQEVDTGPVVCQLKFDLFESDRFHYAFQRSLDLCRKIFEENIKQISESRHTTFDIAPASRILSFKDIPAICADVPVQRYELARDLSNFRGLLPRLNRELERYEVSNHRI